MIELISDLGGGKTLFVRGIVKGSGSHDVVTSPSYVVERRYNCKNFVLHHFDLYRLSEAGILAEMLQEAKDEPSSVVAIEWADVAGDVLPKERIKLYIKKTSESARELTFITPLKFSYTLEKIEKEFL